MKRFLLGTAVLMTSIVGAGIFSLPYAGAQSGFLIAAIFLCILTGIMILLHLLYGEIVSRTKGRHRLVGYADHYLGKWGKGIVVFSFIVGFYASILVYIIMGGDFLYTIFSPLVPASSLIFSLIFFIIGAIAVYFGLRLVSGLDLLMGLFLISIIFLLLYSGFSQIDINNLKIINWHNTLFPYGAILYALAGFAAIPEIKEIFPQRSKFYKKAIILGTLIPAFLYLVFIWTVIGLTGLQTSPEAIQGLTNVLGRRIVSWGALFGFFATITSFFIVGLCLKKMFYYDLKINKNLAWLLACSLPLIVFLLGIRNFISIIVLVGAFLAAVQGTVIVLINKRAKKLGNQTPSYSLEIPSILRYVLILIFFLGFIYTLIRII